MSNKKEEAPIFRRDSVEFVTVAAQFCQYVEKAQETPRELFLSTLDKMLPLLYLKASVLRDMEDLRRMDEEDDMPQSVTEEIYEGLRINLSGVIASGDDYLDVFVEDMRYSDQPVTRYISEDLADIYQDLGNFVGAFRSGQHALMNDALCECMEHFSQYWGQRLLGALRALHQILTTSSLEEDDNEYKDADDFE